MANQETRTLSEQFMLRMPDGMRSRIKRAAEANGRSMNSEILAVLHESYPEPLPGTDLEDRLKTLAQRIAEEPDADERQARLVQFRKELDETFGLKVGAVLDMAENRRRD